MVLLRWVLAAIGSIILLSGFALVLSALVVDGEDRGVFILFGSLQLIGGLLLALWADPNRGITQPLAPKAIEVPERRQRPAEERAEVGGEDELEKERRAAKAATRPVNGRPVHELLQQIDDAVACAPLHARVKLAKRLRREEGPAYDQALVHFLMNERGEDGMLALHALVRAVGRRGWAQGAADALLWTALTAEDHGIRCDAVRWLGALRRQQTVKDDHFRCWLADDSWLVRAVAATAVGQLRAIGLLPEVRQALVEDENWTVRSRSAETISLIGRPSDVALLSDALGRERRWLRRRSLRRYLEALKERVGIAS